MIARSAYVVGAGRLAGALLPGLRGAGWRVAAFARSSEGRARLRRIGIRHLPLSRAGEFGVVFLAVPDAAIASAARSVARHLTGGQVIAHGSGARTLAPLQSARRRGSHPGSLHPVQALAGGPFAEGVTAAVDGDGPAIRALTAMATDLGLRPVHVPGNGRVRYHAAATIAANLCMALADLAVETWSASGAPPDRALPALVPLLRAAVENLAARGLPGALTGPAARGDVEVVSSHLAALDGDAAEIYRLLSRRLVDVAESGGLAAREAARMRRVLAAPAGPARRRRSRGGARPDG